MSSCNYHVCQCQTQCGPSQTLDELDFERGIWYAAQYGDYEKVEKLLKRSGNSNQRDSAGYTALHYAARNGHLNVCKLLLRNGANIDATTKSGLATALHRACSAGKVDIVQLLLTKHADGNMKDSDGKTALHRAAEIQNVEICECILSSFPDLKYQADLKGKLPVDYILNEELCLIFNK